MTHRGEAERDTSNTKIVRMPRHPCQKMRVGGPANVHPCGGIVFKIRRTHGWCAACGARVE